MRWQRSMFQMKEQDKTAEKHLSQVEVDNLPKRIQSNDSKSVSKSWKRNGGRLRRYKKYLRKRYKI